MTLCILTSSYPRSPEDTINAGVFVRDFARACAAELPGCCLFTHRKGPPGEYGEAFQVTEYKWFGQATSLTSVDIASPRGLIAAASLILMGTWGYLRLSRKRRVTHSLAMWAIPSGIFAYAANKLWGVPYSIWALGSDIWCYERHWLVRPLLRRILLDADHLYADGQELAERVYRLTGRPCAFLPSSRDLTGFRPVPLNDDRPRPRYLFVGRYERNKGPDVLLEAAADYLDKGGSGSFDLFGAGSLEKSLRRFIRHRGLSDRIRLHGTIKTQDLVDRLHWCDYLVIPSRIESLPLILSDALQTGTRVIATDVGDMATMVRETGAGIVVPPLDIPALVSAFTAMESQLSTCPASAYSRPVPSPYNTARLFLTDAGFVLSKTGSPNCRQTGPQSGHNRVADENTVS